MSAKMKAVVATCVLAIASFVTWIAVQPATPDPGVRADGDTPVAAALERTGGGDILPPAPDGAPAPPRAAETSSPGIEPSPSAAPLDPHGSLLLHVVWTNDKSPARLFGVSLLPFGSPDPFYRTVDAVTDSEGNVRIARLHAGTVLVRGHLGGQAHIKVKAAEETVATLEVDPGVEVSGIVVNAGGRPVNGAGIILGEEGGHLEGPIVAVTGPDGAFQLRGVAGIHRHLGARAAGFAPSPMVILMANAGGTVKLRLVLDKPGGELRGRVLDPSGAPIPDAIVRAGKNEHRQSTLPDGTSVTEAGSIRARTDADGRFHFVGLAPGATPVVVRALTFAPWQGTTEVAADPASPEFIVRLMDGAQVRGRILDAQGEPAKKVEIQIAGYGDLASSYVQTAADGSYVLEGVLAGDIEITADGGERGTASARLTTLAGGVVTWDAKLIAGPSIQGRLVDAQALPLVGWNIVFESHGAGSWDHKWATTTDDGSFEAKDCRRDSYEARVSAPGTKTGGLKLAEGIRPGTGNLKLQLKEDLRATCYIVGVVAGPDGQPLGGVQVNCWREGQNSAPIELTKERTGRIEFGPLAPGSYRVSLRTPGFVRERALEHVLAAEETWDMGTIKLARGGTAVARLLRGEGTPEGNPVIFAHRADLPGSDRFRIDGGRATSPPLKAGAWRLRIGGKGFASAEIPFDVKDGEETLFDATLLPGTWLTIRITAAEGAALPIKARVVVRDAAGAIAAEGNARSREGRFEWDAGVGPGVYAVEVEAEAGARATGSIEVKSDAGATTLDLAFR